MGLISSLFHTTLFDWCEPMLSTLDTTMPVAYRGSQRQQAIRRHSIHISIGIGI